jgi:hypothetical protein
MRLQRFESQSQNAVSSYFYLGWDMHCYASGTVLGETM